MFKKLIVPWKCHHHKIALIPHEKFKNKNVLLVPVKPSDNSTSSEKFIENGEQFENLVMQALDGFLLVLSADGDIIFVSENVADILGIQQVNFD